MQDWLCIWATSGDLADTGDVIGVVNQVGRHVRQVPRKRIVVVRAADRQVMRHHGLVNQRTVSSSLMLPDVAMVLCRMLIYRLVVLLLLLLRAAIDDLRLLRGEVELLLGGI